MNRVHIFVSGRVQGVFFRATTREAATKLGLTGWVKNCPDGRVEILAEGEEDGLNQFIEWTQKGPELAHVTNIQVDWQEATGEFSAFDFSH